MTRRLLLLLALACMIPPALALVRGSTELGGKFLSGGITPDEIATINDEKGGYPLAILTASKGSGAFLADVHVRITDQNAAPVLDTVMDGPWLLVELPAGQYRIEATLGTAVQKSSVALKVGEHRQAAFYFDTHDDVEPAK